ncbi:hypothetical protein ANN_22451 [Periplaneta americana]|uniref:Uncharacterized protein n=1 Tax=Periplaneta americana TaxID=6978 RepID=A0ABQ8S869_PERAM|nr:hypothetical protein ANN_22451 [Periplaneta americana]
MSQGRLSSLGTLALESSLARELDFEEIIDYFASRKTRKAPLGRQEDQEEERKEDQKEDKEIKMKTRGRILGGHSFGNTTSYVLSTRWNSVRFVRPVTQYLNKTYPGRWIGRVEVISWPPRSLDLTPLDYCLWGWLKSEVYKRRVKTREELLTRILHACAQVKESPNQLRSATQQLLTRSAKCIEVDGGLFEHVL